MSQLHSMALAFEAVKTGGGAEKAEGMRAAMRALELELERS